MKKILAVLLAGMMVLSFAACGEGKADTTTEGTTTQATTTKAPTTPAPGIGEGEDPAPYEDWTLMELATDWHYKVFNCPNTVTADVATFDPETDEMAQWLADKGETWYTDAVEEMKTWEVKTAPMGDRYDPVGEGNSPIGWAGDAHGLICYTTFDLTAEQMEMVKASEVGDIYLNLFYDNTIYLYINGTLVFTHDNAGAAGDWNDALGDVDFIEGVDIRDVLKEGENTIVASLKDGWGGREFIMSIECMY